MNLKGDGQNWTLVQPVKFDNPWARISEIAARVDVKPHDYKSSASICAEGADGKMYDVFEVVAAVLDHIDRKTK